jgi:hypothetical protein
MTSLGSSVKSVGLFSMPYATTIPQSYARQRTSGFR